MKNVFYEVSSEEMMNVDGGKVLESACIGVIWSFVNWTTMVEILKKSICIV